MRYSFSPPEISALCDLRESVGYGRAESDYPAALDRYTATVSAYEGDQLVGWCAAVNDGVRHSFIVDVLVDPAHQRRGVGGHLVREAWEIERLNGITIFHADFPETTAPFYSGCGFRVCRGAVLDESA